MSPSWEGCYPAPAKINLFLHVVGRRADGYHLLQTAFRFLDRGDTLRFSPREDGRIARVDPLPGVAEEADLCLRAARLLQQASGTKQGVDIGLTKRLPMGGGLGGGSSDAATVLLALNHLWGLGLSRRALQDLGLRLGADVPVFVFGRSAFAEGVGEALQPVVLPAAWYLVLEPPVGVSTAGIFAAPELTRNSEALKIADFSSGWGRRQRNDLEPVASRRYPAVAAAIDALVQAAGPDATLVRMSGSGSCVFAEFKSESAAAAVQAELAPHWRSWVARGLNEHPLLGLLEA